MKWFEKFFGKREKVLVVYDAGYITALQKDLDMNRFVSLIRFYCGCIPHKSVWFGTRNPYKNDDWYFRGISSLGIELKLYSVAVRNRTCSHCGYEDEKIVQKGVDVGIAVYVMKQLCGEGFDKLVLIGGDGDFIELVNEVKRVGKSVMVIGTNNTIAEQLKNSADRVVDFADLITMCRKGVLDKNELWSWKQIEKAIPKI